MEGLLDGHSFNSFMVAVVVLLALNLVARIGQFLWNLATHKSKTTDGEISKIDLALTQNTQAVRELRIQVQLLERELGEVHKFKSDSQKLFSAIKIMAGKRWPEVQHQVAALSLRPRFHGVQLSDASN